ncbi:hypothetical protein ACFQZC_12800 [Streptacidiphilus monticola]
MVAVGSSVGSVRDARRTLLEATQVADAALHDAPGTPGAPPTTACRTSGCAACCTCCGRTRACRPMWSGSWGRCSATTRSTAPS